MSEYFDIEHNPKTGKTVIELEDKVKATLGYNTVSIRQGHDLVILGKKELLDLADYIRSQEG